MPMASAEAYVVARDAVRSRASTRASAEVARSAGRKRPGEGRLGSASTTALRASDGRAAANSRQDGSLQPWPYGARIISTDLLSGGFTSSARRLPPRRAR